ncbi:MAG: flagellar biosynthesis anti-sigma factor FlgM [Methylomonas sp.]|jgi:negative regulator of flagellin synthesis FlgM
MAIESISANTPNVPLSAKSAPKDAAGATGAPQSAPTVAAQSVAFSYTSQGIKNAVAASGGKTPEINQERVAALKAAIQSGQYQPDPERIAGKLLQFDKQMPNST